MDKNLSRRRFIALQALAAGTALVTHKSTLAQAGTHVDESDEQAQALGYRHDSSKVDAKKYPKHEASQRCVNCSFWQGKPADTWAGCAMFGRKPIANAGWCQVWAKVA